jgi:hypothetical protein
MNKEKNIINKLIEQGWIVFNPFSLNVESSRYTVVISDTVKVDIDTDGIAPVIADILINAEIGGIDCLLPYVEKYKDNIFVDIYALDTHAELTYELAFPSVKEIIEFKEFVDAETLIYFDKRTEEIIEI